MPPLILSYATGTLVLMPDGPCGVTRIIAAVRPFGRTGRDHQAAALTWLGGDR